MKKLVLSLLAIALTVGIASAQSSQGKSRSQAGQHGQHKGYGKSRGASQAENGAAYGRGSKGQDSRFNKIYDELNLSTDQRARAEQLNTRLKSDLQSLRSNNSLTQEQKRAQMMQLVQRQQADFRAILTYQQQQQFDQMMRDMQAREGNRGQGQKAKGEKGAKGSYNQQYPSSQSSSLLNFLSASNGGSTADLSGILGNAGSANTGRSNFSIMDILSSIPLESILGILLGGLGG